MKIELFKNNYRGRITTGKRKGEEIIIFKYEEEKPYRIIRNSEGKVEKLDSSMCTEIKEEHDNYRFTAISLYG